MKIVHIQQNYNNQSFQAIKPQFNPVFGNQLAVVNKTISKASSNVNELSFWQKVKKAWNLVNKLQ